MEGEEVSLRLKSESDFAVPSLRFASFILPKAFLNRVGFPMAGGGGGGGNRNRLDSRDFICNTFF